jgi:hypothetical protein
MVKVSTSHSQRVAANNRKASGCFRRGSGVPVFLLEGTKGIRGRPVRVFGPGGAPQAEAGGNIERLLTDLKLQWQEKLQPFGEKGYNSLKGYARERNE